MAAGIAYIIMGTILAWSYLCEILQDPKRILNYFFTISGLLEVLYGIWRLKTLYGI